MAHIGTGRDKGRIVGVEGDYVLVMIHKKHIEQRRAWTRENVRRHRQRAKAAKLAAASEPQP